MPLPKTDHLVEIPSTWFTWTANHGCTEITDLRGLNIRLDDLLRPVYQDAADAGFIVISKKTGQRKLFLFAGDLRKYDELIGWKFISYEDDHTSGRYEIHILND